MVVVDVDVVLVVVEVALYTVDAVIVLVSCQQSRYTASGSRTAAYVCYVVGRFLYGDQPESMSCYQVDDLRNAVHNRGRCDLRNGTCGTINRGGGDERLGTGAKIG
jgi:hypothetical protein